LLNLKTLHSIFEKRNLFTAILLAAGDGRRFGSETPKQFLEIKKNFTVLEKSFEAIAPFASKVVIALADGENTDHVIAERLKLAAKIFETQIVFCKGGITRQASVQNALWEAGSEYLFVHDAARANVHFEDVKNVLEATLNFGTAILASPVSDTLKLASPGQTNFLEIERTVDRQNLWAAQTPQAFKTDFFKEAMNYALEQNFMGTDDASLVENFGKAAFLVEAKYPNPKLTYARDLVTIKNLCDL
jgi:2-C-methyl-D-erythritol 4-phosphate cytidylyltransferase